MHEALFKGALAHRREPVQAAELVDEHRAERKVVGRSASEEIRRKPDLLPRYAHDDVRPRQRAGFELEILHASTGQSARERHVHVPHDVDDTLVGPLGLPPPPHRPHQSEVDAPHPNVVKDVFAPEEEQSSTIAVPNRGALAPDLVEPRVGILE